MSNFNAGMRAISICLRIRNEDLPDLFGVLEDDRYSRSRVKSMFYGPLNSKYRHATEEDFFCFLQAIHIQYSGKEIHLSELEGIQEVGEWIDKLVGDLIPPVLNLLILEILNIATDKAHSKDWLYCNQLQLFCIGYLACAHQEPGFDGDRKFAVERLIGLLLGAYMTKPKESSLFLENDFETLCELIKGDLL